MELSWSILSGTPSICDESHEVDVLVIEGFADDRSNLCARQHFAILANPVFDDIADLKECSPGPTLNVRAGTQVLQVSFHPLITGRHLEKGQWAVISSVVNIVETRTILSGLAWRDDVNLNGNGLTVDGNRCRVAHVLPFRFARGLYPRADN